jgi:hypothetical protein
MKHPLAYSLLSFMLTAVALVILSVPDATAQRAADWQQAVEYEMDIDFDVETNRFDGYQKLTYHNQSPDTLNRVFYHLFFNAFQPNSMMDVRSRTIADPDRRVGDRIYYYDETEIGYQRIDRLTQDGEEVDFTVEGTIMEVHLSNPIAPGQSVVFEMDFNAQVPLQTRRSGRDNAEGVRYSMSQWYPKIAAYDEMGWHANPYIGREFYAPFGTFDIKIHIDRDYVVASGSILQNPEEVGYGYETPGMELQIPDSEKLTWHFRADNVHDVMWAADPDYTHTTAQVPGGPLLRFFYQSETVAENASDDAQAQLRENWENLPEYTAEGFEYMSENYGDYPHEEYVVIQGGDGGMEYSMGTLITGNRSFGSLVGVTVHEFVHAWYEGAIGNNEVYDQWIDEGFTVYASAFIMNELFNSGEGDPMIQRYNGYFRTVNAGIEEPMHKHSDHYITNSAYGMASYTKGAMFLHQLGYVIGDEPLKQTLNRFYEEWKFRHPTGYDFLRIAEEESGMNLKWYYEYWVTTTQTIDYGIASVEGDMESTTIALAKNGVMPMPLDVQVTYTDGSNEWYYIPLRIMWGEKENPYASSTWNVSEDWPWVYPEYDLSIDRPVNEIARIEIDPSMRMADINRTDNVWETESAENASEAGSE